MNDRTERTIQQAKKLLAFYYAEGHSPQSLAKTFKVNHKNLELSLSKNPILVTALNPIIGYEKAAAIAKKAYKENKPIIEVAAEETDLTKAKLEKLLDPSKLAKGGI